MNLQNQEIKDIIIADHLIFLFKMYFDDKANAVKSEDLINHYYQLFKQPLHSRDLRRVLGFIRNNDLVSPGFILSNVANGYWLSIDLEEQKAFVNQQLNRMANQFDNIKSLHKRLKPTPQTNAQLHFNLI